MGKLKVMSLNCRGLGGHEKRRDVVNYLKSLDFDIYFLQDTHLSQRKVSCFNALWRGKCYHSCGTHNSRGTSILFKPQIQHNILYEEYCHEGNFVLIICTIFLNTYTLVNLYGPNDDRPAFFHILNKKLEDVAGENIIAGGDFNFVFDHKLDSNYIQQNNVNARNAFVETIDTHNLVDVWRERYPEKKIFTWSKPNPFKVGRLDMFFVQEHLRSHVISTDVVAGYRSDHCIININIKDLKRKEDQAYGSLMIRYLRMKNIMS